MKPLLIALMLTAGPVWAKGLNTDDHITEKLVAGQVGDILRTNCPKVSARMFVVFAELRALEKYAKAQGYTDAEIKAFLKNKTEKKRIRSLADAYLAKAGAKAGDEASMCAAAHTEIDQNTTAGQLLREWK